MRSLICLLLAGLSLALLQTGRAAPAQVSFTQSTETVNAFDFVEGTLAVAQPDAPNPFTDAAVTDELARDGVWCLAETGTLNAVYLPDPTRPTLSLAPGNYQARWFNPRSGQWKDAPVASGPRYTPPLPDDDGDWALTRDQIRAVLQGGSPTAPRAEHATPPPPKQSRLPAPVTEPAQAVGSHSPR